MAMKKSIIVSLLLGLMILGLISFSYSFEGPNMSGSLPLSGVTIDGVINEDEWEALDWKVSVYLDIDDVGNPPDTDGFNYLYLGEDLSNLYVGLDLCSDQTGDTTGEWVGMWLNTNNRTFSDYNEWESFLDNGTESLVYDVENDKAWDFLSSTIGGVVSRVNDDSEYIATNGVISGNTTHLYNLNGEFFNITAEFVNGDYQSWVEFNVDTTKWFSIFEEIFASNIEWIQFQIYTQANISISEHFLYLAYSDGSVNPFDADQVRVLSNGPSLDVLQFNYGAANLSSDLKMKFVLFANSTSPFMTQIDSLHITPYFNMSNSVATVTYPYTSINGFDIEWSFGPSFNNASDHRMYELKIPKSELEHYDPDESLGIIVGGYGTMTFINNNHWVFSEVDINLQEQRSDRYFYFDMKGCVVPRSPTILGYNSYLIFAILGAISLILFKKKYSK